MGTATAKLIVAGVLDRCITSGVRSGAAILVPFQA